MIRMILNLIYNFFYKNDSEPPSIKENEIKHKKVKRKYVKKSIMTAFEYDFYRKIRPLENSMNIKIIPQLNLASIIKKVSNDKYQNELYRNIDFAIFSSDLMDVLLLIELNDNTHNTKERQYRDAKVRNLARTVGIELMTFYSNYENKIDYVQNRIIKVLTKNVVQETIEQYTEPISQEVIEDLNESHEQESKEEEKS